MQGLMQDWPLTVDRILEHASNWHSGREVVTRSLEGPVVRTTYGDIFQRAKRLSGALLELGVKPGDRVATLAWNSARHVEAWYAVMGIGAVCHTLNPRLFAEQLCYIINHAGDKVLITDATFLPVLAEHRASMPGVERFIVLGEPGRVHATGFEGALASEALILHTLVTLQTDVMGLSARDTVLAVVPMFHANAWGLTFSCPAVGAKLVMPGQKLDGASILELLETEKVTFSAAVPTVWQMLLAHLRETGASLSTLKRVVIGGSAVPEAMLRAFHDDYGVEVVHAWGMTETSPLGTLGNPTHEVAALPFEQQMAIRLKQGRAPLGVQLKLTDDVGARQPHDGATFGRLKIKGPFIAGRYFKNEGGEILDDEGYFDTGDVATIDPAGYMQITDRAKDVIKSGGEWISSIEIENIAAGHPKAYMAAVIGVAHPKWDERPLLLVKLKDGETAEPAEFIAFLDGKIARWWMPDDVVFVDDIPLGATGKIDKKLIRQRFANYELPTVKAAPQAASR